MRAAESTRRRTPTGSAKRIAWRTADARCGDDSASRGADGRGEVLHARPELRRGPRRRRQLLGPTETPQLALQGPGELDGGAQLALAGAARPRGGASGDGVFELRQPARGA